ncbi:MAG TPA: ABC transporter permease [Blastocatellia bacterium]|nr:ABC transporter permease [Blastocatellia bacterium]
MEWLNILIDRLRGLFRRESILQDIEDEMREHIEMEIQANIARGMSATQARSAAMKRFGNPIRMVESGYGVRGGGFVETLWHDLRYGARMLRRSPGFTLVALFSLALGIGANTAIFSAVDTLMLRTLPVKDPSRLVFFFNYARYGNGGSLPYPLIERVRNTGTSFDAVFGSASGSSLELKTAENGDSAELVRPEYVTGNYFSALGIKTVIGRTVTDDDDRANNAKNVVVISYDLWKRRFALDPAVSGKAITLNGTPYLIVGVAPPSFSGVDMDHNSDLWLPLWTLGQTPAGAARIVAFSHSWVQIFGRLKPGIGVSQAQAEIDTIYHGMLADVAGDSLAHLTETQKQNYFDRKIVLQPGGGGFSALRGKFSQPLLILMTIVGLVLLIACANVANLLLARAASRQREIAVRLSLGASRWRLIHQLLTESLLLAVIGGALGLVFARWAIGLLQAYITNGQKFYSVAFGLDTRVLFFTFLVSVSTGLLFGLAPAFRATGMDLVPALKEEVGNVRVAGARLGMDKILVIVQVALSLFLLIGAGLFVQTVKHLRSGIGFDEENILLFSISTKPGYTSPQRINLYRQVLAKLGTLPGARSASVSNFYLLKGDNDSSNIWVPGYSQRADEDMGCFYLLVGPRFFETMGIPILTGRDFRDEDNRDPVAPAGTPASLLAVVNQTMANHFFAGQNPIGRHFSLHGKDGADFEIIGVSQDAKYKSTREATLPTFYTPLIPASGLQALGGAVGAGATFELRTFGKPTSAVATVQQEVRAIDQDAQVSNVSTMVEVVDRSLIQERFVAQVASFFSLFALLLASIGLYGILSYGVARRTKEIGIRMALGAQGGNVVWLVMRQSLLLVLIGVAIGIPAALLSTRFVSGLLFGLSASDPATITIATVVLLTVAILAGYLPARRASRIDPMIALRYE